jgi:hypothetical protein
VARSLLFFARRIGGRPPARFNMLAMDLATRDLSRDQHERGADGMRLGPSAAEAFDRPEQTRNVTRGAGRLLRALGYSVLNEFPLPDGGRADLAALAKDGSIRIIEVKSSLADFRSDAKWARYRAFCDRLYFAIPLDLSEEAFPPDAGLIVADAHGAALRRDAPIHRLAPATRRALLVRFGSLAAERLHAVLNPRDGL